MKHIKQKLLCLLIAVMVILQLIPSAVNVSAGTVGNTEDGYVVISFEGLTLGQGFYVEPTLYSYEEIGEILEGNADISNLTSADVTNALLKDKKISVNGDPSNYDMGDYLESVYGFDKGVINVPRVIVDNGGSADDVNSDEWLGEFDYNSMSGWMITHNDLALPVGAADWHLDDNDIGKASYAGTHVIRWMFSLYGYGADLAMSTGWGMDDFFEGADKGELYKLYAEINRFAPEFFAEEPEAKAAALFVMETLDSTQASVDSATESLLTAYDRYIKGYVKTFVMLRFPLKH